MNWGGESGCCGQWSTCTPARSAGLQQTSPSLEQLCVHEHKAAWPPEAHRLRASDARAPFDKFVPLGSECCVFAFMVSPHSMKAHTCGLLKASGRWLYCQEKEVCLQGHARRREQMKWGPALQPTGGRGLWRAVTGGAVLWTRGITFIKNMCRASSASVWGVCRGSGARSRRGLEDPLACAPRAVVGGTSPFRARCLQASLSRASGHLSPTAPRPCTPPR